MSAAPLTLSEFSPLLEQLGPFERKPILAVAVSGGADSMALCLLAQQWAKEKGGHVAAVTIDHGLRSESADEARQVAYWLARLGIRHYTFTLHQLSSTQSNLQEAARKARYNTLFSFCRQQQILHLLTAHHQDDQIETFLMRLERGSGLHGLAGISAINEQHGVRLVRPLLTTPKERLIATLQAAGQSWIEDPSNENPRFTRNRIRKHRAELPKDVESDTLAGTIAQLGEARQLMEREAARLLAEHVHVHHAGYATVSLNLLRAPESLALRCFSALITTIGGADKPPRFDHLHRAFRQLTETGFTRLTLGGCFVSNAAPKQENAVFISREPKALAPSLPLTPGKAAHWDNRFEAMSVHPGDVSVSALGSSGIKALSQLKSMRFSPLPRTILMTFPAFIGLEGLLAVPHIHYYAAHAQENHFSIGFCPPKPLAGPGFYCLNVA